MQAVTIFVRLFWLARKLLNKFVLNRPYCVRCGSFCREMYTYTSTVIRWYVLKEQERELFCLRCFDKLARDAGYNISWQIGKVRKRDEKTKEEEEVYF